MYLKSYAMYLIEFSYNAINFIHKFIMLKVLAPYSCTCYMLENAC